MNGSVKKLITRTENHLFNMADDPSLTTFGFLLLWPSLADAEPAMTCITATNWTGVLRVWGDLAAKIKYEIIIILK